MCTVLLKHSMEYYCVYIRLYTISLCRLKHTTHTHAHTHILSLACMCTCLYTYIGCLLHQQPYPLQSPLDILKKILSHAPAAAIRKNAIMYSLHYIYRPRPQRVYIHRIFTVKGSCGNAGTEGAPLRIMPEKAFL